MPITKLQNSALIYLLHHISLWRPKCPRPKPETHNGASSVSPLEESSIPQDRASPSWQKAALCKLGQLSSHLSANNSRIVGGFGQLAGTAVVQEAVAPAAVADEEEGSEENQRTDRTGLPLQQKTEQVKSHEH